MLNEAQISEGKVTARGAFDRVTRYRANVPYRALDAHVFDRLATALIGIWMLAAPTHAVRRCRRSGEGSACGVRMTQRLEARVTAT